MYNQDYFKEIGKASPQLVKDTLCPKCQSYLGIIRPDRVWCINTECNYGELHIVGEGVARLSILSVEETEKILKPTNMTLNLDTLTQERRNEINTIIRTQILEHILNNVFNGLSMDDVIKKCAEYVNTPEELAYITYVTTGACVSSGLI